MSLKNNCLLITTSSEKHGYEKTRVWHTQKPLKISSPTQATLTQDGDHFVIQEKTGSKHLLTKSQISKSPFELELGNQVKLSVRYPHEMPAPLENYSEIYQNLDSSSILHLHVSRKIDRVQLGLDQLESSYTGTTQNGKVFSLKKRGKEYILKSYKDELKVHLISNKPELLKATKTLVIPEGEISLMTLVWNSYSWGFAWLKPPSLVQWDGHVEEDPASQFFKRGLGISLGLFLFLGAWVWMAPKHELVPVGVKPENIVATTEIKIQETSPKEVVLPSRFFEEYKERNQIAKAPTVSVPAVQSAAPPMEQPKSEGVTEAVGAEVVGAVSKPIQSFSSPHPSTVKGKAVGGSLSKVEKSALALKKNTKALQEALGGIVGLMRDNRTAGSGPSAVAHGSAHKGESNISSGAVMSLGTQLVGKVTTGSASMEYRSGIAEGKGSGGAIGSDDSVSKGARRAYASGTAQENVLQNARAGRGVTYSVDDASLARSGESMGLSTGGLNKQEVSAIIRSHLSEIRYCYEAASRVRSMNDGKIVVKFTVIKDGSVRESAIEEASITDKKLQQCLLNQVKVWKFNKPKNGMQVEISYPFVFHNLASGD